MDTISIIDVKIAEITNQINREKRNIKITHRQCEQMSKNLTKTGYRR